MIDNIEQPLGGDEVNDGKWEQLGRSDGWTDADMNLSSEELEAIGNMNVRADGLSSAWERLPEHIRQILDGERLIPQSAYFEMDEEAYALGWIKGVQEY